MKARLTIDFDLTGTNLNGDPVEQVMYDSVLKALFVHHTNEWSTWRVLSTDTTQTEQYRAGARQLAEVHKNWADIVSETINKQTWTCKEGL